jgi:hypothetical protein
MLSCRYRIWLWAVLLAIGQEGFCDTLTLVTSGQHIYSAPSSGTVSLGWNASSDARATGYFIFWGLSSLTCTNLVDVGLSTNATLSGLATNVAYFFTVVTYDAAGDLSPPSNVISYPSYGPSLGIQPASPDSLGAGISLSFQGNAGVIYYLQVTQDFQNWETILSTNCPATGPMALQVTDAASYPQRFYRLAQ